MKILSATRTYFVLSALALLVILGLRAFAQPPPTEPTFFVKIRNATSLKVTDQVFKDKMTAHNATMDYNFILRKENGQTETVAHGTPHVKLDIKTDRVIVSDAAKNDGTFTLIQTRVTQQLSTSSKTDVEAVLDTLN
jgi:hypothetical protein